MKLDPARFFTDETLSNPMAVAQRYPDCPMNPTRPCFWIVVGPGTPTEICPELDAEQEECKYGRSNVRETGEKTP